MDDILKTANKFYYEINPDSKMDVPSYFYELVEIEYRKWAISNPTVDFYDYCKSMLKNI